MSVNHITISIISLILTIFIIVYVIARISKGIKVIYFILLGFATFGFFDIFKYILLEARFRYLTNEIINYTIFILYLNFLMILFFYYLFKWVSKKQFKNKYNPLSINLNKLILLSYFFIFLEFLRQIVFLWYNTNSYINLIFYFPEALSIIIFYVYLRTNSKHLIFIWILLIISSLDSSSRRIHISLFIAHLLVFLELNIVNGKLRITNAQKIVLYSTLGIFFIFLNYMRAFHDFGGEFNKTSPYENTINYMKTMRSVDTFYNTGFIIENYPSKFKYQYGRTYLSIPVGFVPRSVWPNKPAGYSAELGILQKFGIEKFNASDWQESNMYSLSPGFAGEAYANFGILGVIFTSVLFAFFAVKIELSFHRNSLLTNFKKLYLIVLTPSFFLAFRGSFYDAFIFSLYFIIAFVVILRIIKK